MPKSAFHQGHIIQSDKHRQKELHFASILTQCEIFIHTLILNVLSVKFIKAQSFNRVYEVSISPPCLKVMEISYQVEGQSTICNGVLFFFPIIY